MVVTDFLFVVGVVWAVVTLFVFMIALRDYRFEKDRSYKNDANIKQNALWVLFCWAWPVGGVLFLAHEAWRFISSAFPDTKELLEDAGFRKKD